jgi:hypothetical protein
LDTPSNFSSTFTKKIALSRYKENLSLTPVKKPRIPRCL